MLDALCDQHQYEHTLVNMLAAQFNATSAGDYLALLAYLPQTEAIAAKLDEVRRRIRHVTKRAVTIGFGPAALHTSGQLHKGGANNGLYIQITADHEPLPIPDSPFGFETLIAAQAAGDLEALVARGRRALRLHLTGDLTTGVENLLTAIELAEARRT